MCWQNSRPGLLHRRNYRRHWCSFSSYNIDSRIWCQSRCRIVSKYFLSIFSESEFNPKCCSDGLCLDCSLLIDQCKDGESGPLSTQLSSFLFQSWKLCNCRLLKYELDVLLKIVWLCELLTPSNSAQHVNMPTTRQNVIQHADHTSNTSNTDNTSTTSITVIKKIKHFNNQQILWVVWKPQGDLRSRTKVSVEIPYSN